MKSEASKMQRVLAQDDNSVAVDDDDLDENATGAGKDGS